MEENKLKTLTRSDIADAITEEFHVTKFNASEIVEDVLEQISLALQNGESVKISGFGTFYSLEKNERIGRNPKTMEKVMISKRKSLSFKASNVLKKSINCE